MDCLQISLESPTSIEKARTLREMLRQSAETLVEQLGHTIDLGENSMRRFIPYVQMHEFEGLVVQRSSQIGWRLNWASEDRTYGVSFQRLRE